MTQHGRARTAIVGWLALGWLSATSAVPAAEITMVDVHHTDNHYTLRLEAVIEAPRLAVFHVITDYDRLHTLHRRVRESRVLRRLDARTAEVFTLLRGCVAALFCRTIRRVERVVETPPDRLVATVLPEQSDLTAGEVRWDLEETEQGTLLRYESSMDPDFWVPPLLGDNLLQSSVKRTTLQMIQRVEDQARATAIGAGETFGNETPVAGLGRHDRLADEPRATRVGGREPQVDETRNTMVSAGESLEDKLRKTEDGAEMLSVDEARTVKLGG